MLTDKEITEHDEKYLFGWQNLGIRYYYYLNAGLGILNQFRNLFLGIFALYFALQLSSYWLLGLFFIVSVIILTAVGWYNVHYAARVQEWLGIRFSTHYATRQFDSIQRQVILLEEIRDLIAKNKV